MDRLESFFDTCLNKLLDLGKRNPLVSFKQSKNGSLKFETPSIELIWKDIVNEKEVIFPQAVFFDSDDSDDHYTDESGRYEIKRSPAEACRVLKNLRQKSKTSFEEQGVNTLYLAFGLLKWYESQNSDVELSSPLILVPVSITHESAMAPFVLKITDDDIVVNPTMRYHLKENFDIDLPEFDDDDQSLEIYFDSVREAVEMYSRWSVEETVVCSVFSFLKLSMFEFLKKYKESILSNQLVCALAGDTSDLPAFISLSDKVDFENELEKHNVLQVIDADSSQQEAILRAQEGVSFVLQGPPGTGKSQTITNIIAASIADGKKVLFVSEKSAALDVVYNKLQNAQLADFCLPLHSHKANKQEVLSKLKRSLDLAGNRVRISDAANAKIKELKRDRNELNAYDNELHEVIQPLGRSIYDVYGILAETEGAPSLSFNMHNDIRNISADVYFELLGHVTQLQLISQKISLNPKENPWYGAKAFSLTNEMRGNIQSHYEKCINKFNDIVAFYSDTYESLGIQQAPTYNNIQEISNLGDLIDQEHYIPESWLLKQDIDDEIDKDEVYSKNFIALRDRIMKKQDRVNSLFEDDVFHVDVKKMNTKTSVKEEIDRIVVFVESEDLFSKWRHIPLESVLKEFGSFKDNYSKYKVVNDYIKANYTDDIYSIDYIAMGNRYVNNYHPIIKLVNSQYKADREAIMRCSKEIRKIKDAEILSLINSLKEAADYKQINCDQQNRIHELFGDTSLWSDEEIIAVEKKLEQYQALHEYFIVVTDFYHNLDMDSNLESNADLYGDLYAGVDTDWGVVHASRKWFSAFNSSLKYLDDEEDFIRKMCFENNVIRNDILDTINRSYDDLKNELADFIKLFDDEYIDSISYLPVKEIVDKYAKCCDSFALLEEWMDYKELKDIFATYGLDEFVDEVISMEIEPDDIVSAFKSRLFKLWLDAVLPEKKSVAKFRSLKHNETIRRFRADDEAVLNISQLQVKTKLINQLPDVNRQTSGDDEIGLLRRELVKKRKVMPIRILFARISHLLFALKPCLMMSPLSVSTYLTPDIHAFDLVIFDEASQITSANAVGAISMGKQVIIAGDSKQLPPTNFFETSIDKGDYDAEDDDQWEVYESLLDEANCFKELYLRWHYRSKNENLIAFSNTTMYRNQLFTFPSNKSNSEDEGVKYFYVEDGRYDRGGRAGNPIEAQQVADMVFDHFRKYPDRSLGVITFGSVQQNAIEDAIDCKRIEDPSFEKFFSESMEEPFFIKNLETVQGDERDTIIFSIGYAKDHNDRLTMNFGPLNAAGGERRLNVAVTRAKYNLKLVGSILPTNLNVEKSKSEGLKLLRTYIEYAQNGPEVLDHEITENENMITESPFEESVLRFLERKGYKMATQVGCSNYRIDLAVKHPELSGVYVLGIECDGASYHSSRTARERDRLRQQILERMGWKLYRIWSTDWIKDPKTEQAKLVDAVEQALNNYGENEPRESLWDKPNDGKLNMETECDLPQEDDVYLIKKEAQSDSNPYGFKEYKATEFRRKYYYSPKEIMDDIFTYVVDQCPVHIDQMYHELLFLTGKSKLSQASKNQLDYYVDRLYKEEYVIQKGDFLYPYGYNDANIKVKIHSGRKIDYFSDDELEKALYMVATKSYGVTPEGLVQDTILALELPRGCKSKERMKRALDNLIRSSILTVVNGVVSIN